MTIELYLFYLAAMSVLTFLLMALDKRRAVKRRWRIPEVVLLGLALLGGSFGGFLAMHLCHHKTRHARFAMGIPAMMVAHVCIAVYLLDNPFYL